MLTSDQQTIDFLKYTNETPKPSTVFDFSVNRHGKNKDFDNQILTNKYERRTGTIEDLKKAALQGWALCAGNLARIPEPKRHISNFADSQLVFVDVDNAALIDGKKTYVENMTVEQALRHPFVEKYCALLYTSASHSDNWHKFRLVFVLPFSVTLPAQYKSIVNKMLKKEFTIASDKQCSDVVRVFYGNSNAYIPLCRPSVVLDAEWLNETVEESCNVVKAKVETTDYDNEELSVQTLRKNYSGSKLQIATQLSADLDPNGMNWGEWRDVLFAFHDAGMDRYSALSWSKRSGLHSDSGFSHVFDNIKGHPNPITIRSLLGRYKTSVRSKVQETKPRNAKLTKPQYQATKRYTPNKIIDVDYITADLIEDSFKDYDVVFIKSSMGQGKTQASKVWFEGNDKGALAMVPRNTLGIQCAETFSRKADPGNGVTAYPFYHLIQDNASMFFRDVDSRMILCPESIIKCPDSGLKRYLLLLDEASTTRKQILLSSTCDAAVRGGRDPLLAKFEVAVRSSEKVLLLDGNMSDADVAYYVKLRSCDPSRVLMIENIRKPFPLNIQLITAIDDKSVIKAFRSSPLVDMIVRDLERFKTLPISEPRTLGIILDNQTLCENISEKILKPMGYNVWRIDGVTTKLKETKEALKDPNQHIKDNQFDVIILTTSAETGFDINLRKHFAKGYALLHGVVGTDSQMQFIRRLRYCIEWIVWCAETGFNPMTKTNVTDENLEKEQGILFEANPDNVVSITALEQIKANPDNIHKQNVDALNDVAEYERKNNRECFVDACLAAGHNITEVLEIIDDETEKTLKNNTDEIKKERAEAIFNADDITDTQLKEINLKASPTQEEFDQQRKANFIKRVPGIQDTEFYNAELIEKTLIRKTIKLRALELFVLANNADISHIVGQKYWTDKFAYITDVETDGETSSQDWVTTELRTKNVFIPDLRCDFLFLQKFIDIGLLDLVNSDEIVSQHSEAIKAIERKLKHCKDYSKVLGVKGAKTPIMTYISRLVEKVGCKMRFSHTVKTNGEKERFYNFETPYNDAETAVIVECIKDKYLTQVDETDRSTWVVIPRFVTSAQQASGYYKATYHVFKVDPVTTSQPDIELIKELLKWIKVEEDINRKIVMMDEIQALVDSFKENKELCPQQLQPA